ncbi:protein KHNYN [Salmo salar]|uniref:Protein KHNYN n=1 Tax=Salmo salar TaxID=8030 RepID=A0A1S3SEG8_SALSA|nr:protein KHNYN-like [Salmo salar]
MASALSHLSPVSGREREGWSDGGGGEDQVEDEFACSGALRGALLSFHPSLERIFGVSFMIGREEDAVLPHDGQIWLKLKGGRKDVVAAKLFVKGVVNQEAPQEVPYPGVLHCVFCGARGLFMDCLIRNTSARIVVVSPGFLLISGLAEPVVRAYSLITDLVERSEGTQGRLSEPRDRAAGETLDSRRAFKSLVERWDDRHTLDLLVLPGAVKETLLDLVRESGLGSNPGPGGLNPGHGGSNPGHGGLNPGPGLGSNPIPGLGLNLGLGGSRDRVGLMDTDTQRLWDSQFELEALTLMDTRIGTRAGEARDIQEVQGISITKSTTKPSEHSYHNQDPGLRNIGLFSQQTVTTAPVKGREGSRYGTQGGIGNEASPRDPIFHSFPQNEDIRGRAEGSEGAKGVQGHSPQEVKEEGHREEEEEIEEGEGNMMLSVGTKEEFGLLLKFFTAMGYAEDVVLRVLAQTRPREASQILDLVQQEQDRTRLAMNSLVELEHREGEESGGEEVRGKRSSIDKRVEMEGAVGEGVRAREEQRAEKGRGGGGGLSDDLSKDSTEVDRGRGEGGRESDEGDSKGGEVGNEEDFVLGVLKRAAANCGYTEEKVTEVYSMLPELSIRQLLLELQREGTRETEAKSQDRVHDEPRELDEVVSEVRKMKGRKEETEKERGKERKAPAQPFTTTENREVERKSAKGMSERKTDELGGVKVPNRTIDGPVRVEPDLVQWNAVMNQIPFPTHGLQKNPTQTRPQPAQTHTPRLASPPLVRGPPQPTYPITLPPQPTKLPLFPHQLIYPLTQPPQTTLDSTLTVNNSSATRVKEKRGFLTLAAEVPARKGLPTPAVEIWGLPPMAAGSLVTGQQRFLEGLQTPFDLKLTDQPGDPGLRMVVIDGSNVAMSHGLGHLFSCRGIALAVQHFWNRGHRGISTLLPQWRQKRDPRVKEQHYLTELQNLGLLSYTPSREVQGKRINSYDDRVMLQLAERTDGVIVTNDNLRDLLDESPVWMDIIKKRLLQYTFVGDHFMVPDDPLGREGPHLDDFLRSLHRTPVPGSHSFAGIASTPIPQAPRAQTEVLKFRDRTPGVGVEPESSQAQSRGKRKGQAKAGHSSPGMDLVPGMGLGLDMERSAAETSRLRERLSQVFPGQDSIVTLVLQCNPTVTDINSLSHFMLQQQMESEQGGED